MQCLEKQCLVATANESGVIHFELVFCLLEARAMMLKGQPLPKLAMRHCCYGQVCR